MKFLVLVVALVGAGPALGNSFEDAVCRSTTTAVAQMEAPKKLCLSFVRALHKLPEATADEARAFLTPENVALMAVMTATWVGTQGVPIVGQAVDAALLALGVTLLAMQSAALVDSVWRYVNLATSARSHVELDKAADHLAGAISAAGLNVVAFILTKRTLGKGMPPSVKPSPRLATARGPATSWAVVDGAQPSVWAPAVAMAGLPPSPHGGAEDDKPQKVVDQESFSQWIERSERRPVRGTQDAYEYQRVQAGPEEVLAKGGGEQIWADGQRRSSARLVETKYVDVPEKSPFIDGSKCHEKVRHRIQQEVAAEFKRYAAVIKDPSTPAVALEVVVNDARAVPFFESLLKRFNIPGEVIVRPRGELP